MSTMLTVFRKKMSIIVLSGHEVILYCKGADSEILSSLAECELKSSKAVQLSKTYLERYSVQGLRTLCLAKRTLTFEEYERWQERHVKVSTSFCIAFI